MWAFSIIFGREQGLGLRSGIAIAWRRLGEAWRRSDKGSTRAWRRLDEGLAKGWRKLGKGLARAWRGLGKGLAITMTMMMMMEMAIPYDLLSAEKRYNLDLLVNYTRNFSVIFEGDTIRASRDRARTVGMLSG